MSAVLMISQLLRLSSILVTFGLSLENILLPILFILIPFMSIITPISFLFATLLTFSRFHADGEWTALLASGYSLRKAFMPVLCLSLIFYGLTSFISISLEAWGRREFEDFVYRKTQTEIDNILLYKVQDGVFINDFLDYVFYTEKTSRKEGKYSHVLMAPNRNNKRIKDFVLSAESAQIQGSVSSMDLRMSFTNGFSYTFNESSDEITILKFDNAQIDLLRVFTEKILGEDSSHFNYRGLPIMELYRYIQAEEKSPSRNEADYLRARYLFHSRVANPFIIFAFAILGMILSLGNLRENRNWVYFEAVGSIIASFVLIVTFRSFAEQGSLDAFWAVWIPQALLLLVSGFLFYQRNRLPPSEGLLHF